MRCLKRVDFNFSYLSEDELDDKPYKDTMVLSTNQQKVGYAQSPTHLSVYNSHTVKHMQGDKNIEPLNGGWVKML